MQPFTLYQPTTHDTLLRTGLMFQNWSNSRIDLPVLLPSFVKTANSGYLPNTVIPLAFLLLVLFALMRRRAKSPSPWHSLVPALIFLVIFSLSSLFPRPDPANPQMLIGPRDLPCQVFFNPAAAPGGEKATWTFSGRHGRMRIETLVPLKSVAIGIENRSDREPLDMTVFLFDAAAADFSLQPGAADQVRLDRPRYKKIKSRYGYQFDLQVRNPATGTAPAWLLGLKIR